MVRVDTSDKPQKTRRQKLKAYRGLSTLKTTVVVVVDGKTEIAYFEKLNQENIFPNIRFKVLIGDEINFYHHKQAYLELPHVFLILDIDNANCDDPNRKKRIEALLKSKTTQNAVFYNNYSFETFLINHITEFGKPIVKKEEYNPYMKQCFSVDSWSNNKDERQIAKVIKCIDETTYKKMRKNIRNIQHDDCFNNPSTNMHVLFEKVEKIK